MDILTIKLASEKWGISTRRISALCEQGRIPGAVKTAGVWLLPPDSQKPADARVKNEKYIGWRNKMDMSSRNYESNIKNIKGTFAVEGMSVSENTIANLKRLSDGKISCDMLVEEIKEKYLQRV